jgi:hypothetical protein
MRVLPKLVTLLDGYLLVHVQNVCHMRPAYVHYCITIIACCQEFLCYNICVYGEGKKEHKKKAKTDPLKKDQDRKNESSEKGI